ncbi:MAG: hypothetical protein HQL36_06495 [Alphaproteobacteria bacterium]|nr:hypothetical protein [Alphaproteobacteria bacterium]MBF0251098.1 hypothetical protein [Alphaproteobacteria bacterium]
MNSESNFLIVYGLQNFVSCATNEGRLIFTIRALQSDKMVRHAMDLINGRYGKAATVQVA